MALYYSICNFTKRSAFIPEEMGVDKRLLHSLKESGITEWSHLWQRSMPKLFPLRESHLCMYEAVSRTWQLSCYQMQQVNQQCDQQETKRVISFPWNWSAQKWKKTHLKNIYRHQNKYKIHTWRGPPEIPPLALDIWRWIMISRDPCFLGQCGTAIYLSQPATQTLFLLCFGFIS